MRENIDQNNSEHRHILRCVYSPNLNGGLCNVCVHFDDPDVKNRGIFVKKAFQDLLKLEKVKEHNSLQYHQATMLKTQKLQKNYEEVYHCVNYDPNKEIKFKQNQYVVQPIIEAVLLCGKYGIPLRGHREQDINYIGESRQRPPNQENFIPFINAFAKHDEILINHFLTRLRNAQYLSPQIQNDIIGSISEFVPKRIRETLKDHVNYAEIANEVTACKQRDNVGVFKILADYREESNFTRMVLRFKSYVW